MPSKAKRAAISIALMAATALVGPRAMLGVRAGPLWAGDRDAQEMLAYEVVAYEERGVSPASFHTGSARFDGEWALVTHVSAVLGIGQIVLAHPELTQRYRPALVTCGDRLLDPATLAFGAEAWGAAGLDDPRLDHGHAYLGYLGLALGMLRRLAPEDRFVRAHDRVTRALVDRLERAPFAILETYPGEAYPADTSAVVGAIGLFDRTAGADHRALLARFAATARARFVDARSGLLHQVVDAKTGAPLGPPRASGTALAAYFLWFADPALSRDLFAGVARTSRASFLGFGGVREHAPGHEALGDIDSGPTPFGIGVSATGFAIAGARLHRERAFFTELYRTATLFGVPRTRRGGGRRFLTGGPLGNALLLAMLTAGPTP
jgi:hypothetical protein